MAERFERQTEVRNSSTYSKPNNKIGITIIIIINNNNDDDNVQGAELLKRLASGSVDADLMSKYTALAASYCLIRYVENARGLAFADAR